MNATILQILILPKLTNLLVPWLILEDFLLLISQEKIMASGPFLLVAGIWFKGKEGVTYT